MTRNLRTENAHNNAAAPSEQKSKFGGIIEATAETLGESIASSPDQSRAPPERMLRFPDVIAQTGLSRTTIWRKIRCGQFPAPRQLSENAVGWPEDEITAWVANRPRVQYAPGPEASAA